MANLLSNDKITLRAMEPSDIDLIYKWENDTSLWTVSDTVAPYSREALMLYIANCANDIYANKQLRLMVTLTATGETVARWISSTSTPFTIVPNWVCISARNTRAETFCRNDEDSERLRRPGHRFAPAVCVCA